MNVTYWCFWYRKALSRVLGDEMAICEKGGRYCAICKDCRLRKTNEVKP